MSTYEFQNALVAIDGSDGSAKALDCAFSICSALGAKLTMLAIEGKLPAYAASLGEVDEVDEVKREKDEFFSRVLADAERQAAERGVNVRSELLPGRSAGVILHHTAAHSHDLMFIAHQKHFLIDVLLSSTADRVADHAHAHAHAP
jgi:nucleotide-binding universal stress UspA family protein